MTESPEELPLRFPESLAADFPADLPAAERAVTAVLAAIENSASFGPLEDRSPGLRGNDWSNYLRCSEARMVHAAHLLRRKGITSGRILDYGAYFGNFSLMFREAGFEVDAADAYASYQPSLDPILHLLGSRGIRILDYAEIGRDLAQLPAGQYDAVLCMGVIEHIPHTPRTLLASLDRVLKPGGVLIMDTPNVAQLPNRQRMARGEPVMTPMAIQYHATIPFEGHHREYTASEMAWMVQEAGHQLLALELFNYSAYGYDRLTGRDVSNHWRMVLDPSMRELIMVASRKPATGVAHLRTDDWRSAIEEVEPYWQARVPPGLAAGGGLLENELLIETLQEGIAVRDRMLAELQAERTEAVVLRDRLLASLTQRNYDLKLKLKATESERIKKKFRGWLGRPEPPDED